MAMDAGSEVVDCDIHLVVPSVEVLLPYLTDPWRQYIRESAFKGPVDTSYPRGTTPWVTSAGGTDLARTRDEALDAGDVACGILNCAYAVESIRNPFAAAALAAAVNDWQIEHWLGPEPRLRGSVVVPSQDAELAAQEIDRVGDHRALVQVLLPVRAEALYGNRRYYPIYEAALRHGLAVGIRFGGQPGNPPTAAGWPSHYVEEYVGMAHVFQSQLISLVTEGIFDRFPDLRVVLIESGVSWLPSLLWRLDKEWKGLRREVPWVRRLPSAYVRDHVRLTTEPLDLPTDPGSLLDLIDQLGSDELLMFGSAYPLGSGNGHAAELRHRLPEAVARKVLRDNAAACYRLD